MKTMKKLLAVALALVLALSLCTVSLAADPTYTITINNSVSGHTYEAYQIFSGDVTVDQGNKILTNVDWGNGINDTAFLPALKGDGTIGAHYTDCSSAADVAKVLGDNKGDAEAFAELAGGYLQTAAGTSTYNTTNYTIGNLDAGYYLVKDQNNSTIDAYTAYILEVVGDVTVSPKSDTTTSEKKVKDINNSTETDYGNWQDSADHDIGDSIPFRLSATLPENYGDYDKFAITFHDEQFLGLDFSEITEVYYTDASDGNSKHNIASGYSLVTQNLLDDCTFEVDFTNLKTITGLEGGDTIYVEYESTLNEDAVIGSAGNPNTMYLTYSNNPYSTTDRGRTVDDTVIVFTYKVVVNKVDGETPANPLKGAKFKLEKKNSEGTYILVKEIEADADDQDKNTFTFKGLDDGQYKLTETVTPAGYNTMEPIEFTVTATHDITSDSPALTDLSGNVTTGEITFTKDVPNGSLSTNVVNEQGLVLPTTGGIGTTLFYIGGIVLVLGAASCLIVKLYRKKNI